MIGLYVAIDPTVLMSAIFLAFCVTSFSITLYTGRYRLSNMRARLDACPPSSVWTAENLPPTDHGARTASKNAPHASTPDPSPTPPSVDWGRRTVHVRWQWWQQHRCVACVADRRPRTTHSPRTTQCRDHRAVETARCAQHTDHATAGPGAACAVPHEGRSDTPGGI